MPIVDVDGVGEIEFPDDMPPEQIKSVLKQKFGGQTQPKLAAPGGSASGRQAGMTSAVAGSYEQQPEKQPGGKGWLESAAGAVKEFVAPSNVEDLPEFLVNTEMAQTPEGKLNIIKERGYPEARLDTDKFGNPVVVPGKPIGDLAWGGGLKRVTLPPEQKYYLNKPGASLADIDYAQEMAERVALPVAASAAFAPASPWLAAGAVGASGALGEGLKQAEAQEIGAKEGADIGRIAKEGVFAALGEGGGRALAYGIGSIANVFRRLSGSPKASISQFVDESGNLTLEGSTVLKDNGMTLSDLGPDVQSHLLALQKAGLTPQAVQRLEDFQAIGARPTKAQITREFPAFQFEQETAKLSDVGGPLRQRAMETGGKIRDEFGRLVSETGGADNPVLAGQAMQQAVRKKFEETGSKVSGLYQEATEAAGKGTFIPKDAADAFHGNVRDVVDDFEDVIPGPIRKRLTEFSGGDRAFTLDEAEKFRKLINMRYEAGDQATKAGLNRIKTHLDEAINSLSEEGGAAAGMFKQARSAASERFKEFGANRTTKENKVIAALVDDSIPEEQILNKTILNSSVRDLRSAKFLLTHGTDDQIARGTAAFNDMRGATMRWIADNSRSGTATDELGQPLFSGANLKKVLEKLGDEKLGVIFTEPERAALRRLDRIGEALSAPPGSVNYSGTSAALMNIFNRFNKIPGAAYMINMVLTARKQMQAGAALEPGKKIAKEAGEEVERAARAERSVPRAGTAIGSAYGGND